MSWGQYRFFAEPTINNIQTRKPTDKEKNPDPKKTANSKEPVGSIS